MYKIGTLMFFLFPLYVAAQMFAVIGDYRGGDTNAYNVSQLVKSWNPEFIVTTGDNFLYTQGTIDFQIGQFYHDFIFPYVGSYGSGDTVNCFFPAIGNHDVEGTGLDDYLNYFSLPGNERYYDFVKGNVHFFILNSDISEVDGNTDSSAQALWFHNAISASQSKYNLVFLHHPPYSSGLHGCNLFSQWPFKQWGATAVFSGHDHNYERLLIDSLSYFVCGAGGGGLYCTFSDYPGTQHFYCENYGALIVQANNDSILFEYYNIADSLIDHYVLFPTSTGISQIPNTLKKEKLSCYPNPIKSTTTIKYFLEKEDKPVFTIVDSNGKKIKTYTKSSEKCGIHEFNLNLSYLSNGRYTLEMTLCNKIYSLSILKTENN